MKVLAPPTRADEPTAWRPSLARRRSSTAAACTCYVIRVISAPFWRVSRFGHYSVAP